jgi:hypothetical protein
MGVVSRKIALNCPGFLMAARRMPDVFRGKDTPVGIG